MHTKQRAWLPLFTVCSMYGASSMAAQYSLESSVSGLFQYNDNILLTTAAHDTVYGLELTPNARLKVKEQDWETYLNIKLRNRNYSDKSFETNDLYFDVRSSLQQERNVFSVDMSYNKDSSLNTQSSDFSIANRRVNTTRTTVSPAYRRILSERASIAFSASVSNVSYDDLSLGFVPYGLQSLSASYVYGLSESSKLSFVTQATDYQSDDGAFAYTLHVFQAGMENKLDELWTINASLGSSRRDSSNQTTQTFDFFGQPITLLQVVDGTTTGVVLDVDIKRELERGSCSVKVSRNETANSFGGLNEVSSINYKRVENLSAVWRLIFNLRHENIKAVGQATRNTDRTLSSAEIKTIYSLDRNWSVNASYRYITREFDNTANNAADSNRIFVGMTYNFPDISTF